MLSKSKKFQLQQHEQHLLPENTVQREANPVKHNKKLNVLATCEHGHVMYPNTKVPSLQV